MSFTEKNTYRGAWPRAVDQLITKDQAILLGSSGQRQKRVERDETAARPAPGSEPQEYSFVASLIDNFLWANLVTLPVAHYWRDALRIAQQPKQP